MAQVTIGFRAHTGWAVAVALAGTPATPAVVDRRRLDLTDPEVPRQAFHVAADLDAGAAGELVERATRTAEALAEREVRGLVGELRSAGHEVAGTGIALGSGRQLGTLAQILASHAAMHAAEGELYRDALMSAAELLGVRVQAVTPDALPDAAEQVRTLGVAAGRPWRREEKDAARCALVAMTGS
jgi:hypothetical protein